MFQVCRDKTQNWYVTAASQIWNDDVAEKWQADNCKADKAERGATGLEIERREYQISDIFIILSGAVLTRLKVTLGIKIQAGGGVSRSKSELSWIITSGAQWLQPASITRKPSRQKTPGKNSPASQRVKVNQIGKVEIWKIFLTASGDQCCVIAWAALGWAGADPHFR